MAWQLARNLDALRAEIRQHLPNVTIYTIGDEAHQQRTSDHNPDDTTGSRAEQSDSDTLPEVRAIDIMLAVSDQSMRIVQALVDPRSRPRLKYVIHGGRIWSRTNGWAVRAFDGDPHNDHIHVSGLAADDANGAGWPAVAEIWEDDVAPEDITAIKNAILLHDLTPSGSPTTVARSLLDATRANAAIAKLEEKVDALAGEANASPAEIDYDKLAAALLRRIATEAG